MILDEAPFARALEDIYTFDRSSESVREVVLACSAYTTANEKYSQVKKSREIKDKKHGHVGEYASLVASMMTPRSWNTSSSSN